MHRVVAVAAALAAVACSEHEPAGPLPGDSTPPSVTSAVAWDVHHIVVVFGERVTRQTAEDPANYHVAEYTPPGGPETAGLAALVPSFVHSAALHADNRTVTLTTEDMLDITYALTVSGVSDLNGNVILRTTQSPFDGTVELDVTPPAVVFQVPAPGASGVSTGGFLMIEFNEAVRFSTLFNGLNVAGEGAKLVSIGQDDDLHYACDLDLLQTNTTYTVSLSGVEDVAGNIMPDAQWTFTTETTADVKAPTVVASWPENRAVNVGTDTRLSLTFSEPMDPSSVKVRPSPNFGAKHWTAGFRKVTYETTWWPGTQYTVQIRPGEMRDEAGNVGEKLFTLTFTTGGALETGSLAGTIAGDPTSAKASDPTGGLVFASMQSSYDLYTSVVAVVAADDTYEIPRLPNANYFPFYVMDSNGDRLFQPNYGDAIGIFGVTDWYASQTGQPIHVGDARVSSVDFRVFDPAAVYGFLSYDGLLDGKIYVGLFAPGGFDPLTSVPVVAIEAEGNGTWDYIINSLVNGPFPGGEYYVVAYMDFDRNGVFDPTNDPIGVFGGATPVVVDLTNGNDAPAVSILVKDPVPGANARAVRWPVTPRSDRLDPYLRAVDEFARD